jgi:hypothetical protein
MFAMPLAARGSIGAVVLLSLAACSLPTFNIQAPTPSGLKTEVAPSTAAGELSLVDRRQDVARQFHTGLLGQIKLNHQGAPIDSYRYLATGLQAELASRGYATHVATEDKGTPRLNLRIFNIQNHRVSGFSPWVTMTYLSADLETAAGPKRLGAFVKRGKVPVWSIDEVVEPTYNQPLTLAIQELAGKVAVDLYGYRASDATVDRLVAKLAQRTENSYLDVYALGFTSNPRAVPKLVELTKDAEEYVRLAAISSLGNLRAIEQFDLLRSICQGAELWQDRGMAIKAIGDLGTPEAKEFLASEMKRWENQATNNEALWTMQIIRLFQ